MRFKIYGVKLLETNIKTINRTQREIRNTLQYITSLQKKTGTNHKFQNKLRRNHQGLTDLLKKLEGNRSVLEALHEYADEQHKKMERINVSKVNFKNMNNIMTKINTYIKSGKKTLQKSNNTSSERGNNFRNFQSWVNKRFKKLESSSNIENIRKELEEEYLEISKINELKIKKRFPKRKSKKSASNITK